MEVVLFQYLFHFIVLKAIYLISFIYVRAQPHVLRFTKLCIITSNKLTSCRFLNIKYSSSYRLTDLFHHYYHFISHFSDVEKGDRLDSPERAALRL